MHHYRWFAPHLQQQLRTFRSFNMYILCVLPLQGECRTLPHHQAHVTPGVGWQRTLVNQQ